MPTSKVYIFKNDEGMWECGTILVLNGEETYITKHEAATWEDLTNWVQLHYVH